MQFELFMINKMSFLCDVCGVSFTRKASLVRHKKTCDKTDATGAFECPDCHSTFSRMDTLKRHQTAKKRCLKIVEDGQEAGPSSKKLKMTPPEEKFCDICKVSVLATHWIGHQRSLVHKNRAIIVSGGGAGPNDQDGITVINTAFHSRIITYRITPPVLKDPYQHVGDFLHILRPKVFQLIREQLMIHRNIKFNLELFGLYYLPTKDVRDVKSFNTKNVPLTESDNLEDLYDDLVAVLDTKASEFAQKDSGWSLQFLTHLEININKYNPLRGNSYISLPKQIAMKKAVLNIQNNDNKCFLWSVLAHLHRIGWGAAPQRVGHYQPYEDTLNMDGIEYPVTLKSIPQFELNNQISINVYGLEKYFVDQKPMYKIVGPLHYTKNRFDTHINLLLITDDDGGSHYCLIRDMSRLLSSQINSRDHRKFLCDGCLNYFKNEQLLQRHQQHDCNHISTRLPSATELKKNSFGDMVPQNLLQFDHFSNQFKAPFVIYADFESLLQPIDHVQPNPAASFTVPVARHVPHSFAYYIKCSYDDQLSKFVTYRGEDCVQVFIQSLEADVRRIWTNFLENQKPMLPLTIQEQMEYDDAVKCHICQLPFGLEENKQKVRDHDHCTGLYRGSAHSICNLNYKPKNHIPCFFHNMSNYDAHLFVRELGCSQEKFDVIAQTKEKYICFSKHLTLLPNDTDGEKKKKVNYVKIRFLDSLRFMASSLEKLAQNLEPDQCREVRRHFPDDKDFQYVRRKGVFPYSYVDGFDKLEDLQLPSYEQFFDKLRGENIRRDDYERAINVWNAFGCETLGQYSDLYLTIDVLLLADVFENFRDVCMDTYGLDPANYLTAPSLTWDAMLKYTGVVLELLVDVDKIHFLKKGIRGGISQCSTRRAVANNQFAPNYDPSKPKAFLAYIDATNLYGAAMCHFALPQKDFEWLTDEEIQKLKISTLEENGLNGYIFEVDLEYPDHLHDLHNDLPFCPEAVPPPGGKLPKLMPNFNDKKNYIIHYRNLQQALEHGLHLTKIHRVLKFTQAPFLKPYIELNTAKRNAARNKFEKDFFKLMNNAVFGKTMENVDKRVDVRLVTHWDNIGKRLGAEALIAKPQFKSCSVFCEDLAAIEMSKTEVVYDKPIYIGFSILELSKLIMYDFFYGYLKPKYGDKVNLLYMDTDSFVLLVHTENYYEDIKGDLNRYDTSNYAADNRHGIPSNVSVLGRMKDEYAGRILYEFVGTGSKAYAVDVENQLTAKAKGVPYHVTAGFNLDIYRHIVQNPDAKHLVDYFTFRSRGHNIFTEMQRKVALSYMDDKRVLIPDSYKTYAWGHRALKERENLMTVEELDDQ